MNDHIAIVIVAPLTTKLRNYPTRVNIRFRNRSGQAALDQIRAVDKTRLVRKLGEVSSATADEVAAALVEIFRRQ
jgi:mRNA interferase MazF